MKEFRKNQENLFVCEECGKAFTSIVSLSHHISVHCNNKQYFDKWIKEEKDDACVICGNETNYLGWNRGYSKTCCDQCKWKKTKNTIIKIYGVDNPSKILDAQNRRIKTYKSHINEINVKRNNTYLLRFGGHMFKNKKIKDNIKQTCIEKYDVEYPMQNKEVQEKSKETCLKNNGVEHPNQNKNILEKALKTALTLKRFRDTDLWYQGTFELDFLDKYWDIFPNIIRGPSIKYIFKGKNKVYHPDFFISSLNLIVEIKNSWHAKTREKSIEEKRKATIANGFNYIMIIDKNYEEFETKIKI